MAIVYIHRNPVTSIPFYVGIGTDLNRPYKNAQRSVFWTNYFKKYGKETQIVGEYSLEDARELEIFLIATIGRRCTGEGPLVNITKGGEGFFSSHSAESKKKMSEAHRGLKKPWAGKGQASRKYRYIGSNGLVYDNLTKAFNASSGTMKKRTFRAHLDGSTKINKSGFTRVGKEGVDLSQ